MTDKALLATPPTAATTKLSDKKQLRQPGAVKITLHSANNTVDEKAEVRVALNNPEDAVEKMLQTLAQRFPPESVMTIAPVKGVDQSGSSSEVPDGSGSATGSRFSSSSEMLSQRREASRLMGVTNPELIRSSIQSGAYVALSPEIRQGMASLPSEYTNYILANDPALLPELLNLATRGGDTKAWATQVGLDPTAVANIVNALRNDPAFYEWVSKLASAALSPQVRGGRTSSSNKKRRSKHKHQSIPTPQGGTETKVVGHEHQMQHMHPPYSTMGATLGGQQMTGDYYHGYPIPTGVDHQHATQAGMMHSPMQQMPGYPPYGSPAAYGSSGYPPLYASGAMGAVTAQQPPMPPQTGTAERASHSGGDVQPSRGSRQSVDAARQTDQQYPFDQAGPGETIEILPDGTRVRYVETPVFEEQIVEIPGKKEIIEVEKRVPKQVEKIVEKIVEVPEIQYVERRVDVEKVEEVVRHVPRKEVVDVMVDKVKEVQVIQNKIVEKIIEVPHIVERPKVYTVEQKVSVPRYVNRETQTVVAQKLRPVVKEGKKQKVAAKKYEPVLYAVDVPIPKPVYCGFMPLGKVDEYHSIVEIPAPQYNSLLQAMNRNIDSRAIEDLFVRTDGGRIPLLPAGELTEIVPPLPGAIPSGHAVYTSSHRKHRSRSPIKHHRKHKSRHHH
eukprot:Blabericola_migrator_1__11759@NODE_711_length_6770_cov_212_988065_g510_i1_p2_GENE_NODE_711_length_6770_cov_212_988065_g510_i1NODE_711_length_6770_cov_212_988065_g510_i1_p2_ORF_typecomplete_len671_score114_98IMCp/PF12314_8/63IMCp/PF12314_8/5_2e08IMCp/PF12314_8/19IMCp/PF12314_8/3_7e03Ins_allergen_rp/PF06757_13/5_9e02Ins_allergen_rp/PF06757_13/0_49DUF4197/PF13852_6/9_3e02DUF4197/PF13852_6/0_5_NODE_711_length_6770_cov_212_988065_g510_i145546566